MPWGIYTWQICRMRELLKIPAGFGGSFRLLSDPGFQAPHGVAVDASGNVFVVDSGHGLVKMIPAGGGNIITLNDGILQPNGVAVDASDNLYAGDVIQARHIGAFKWVCSKIAPCWRLFYQARFACGASF